MKDIKLQNFLFNMKKFFRNELIVLYETIMFIFFMLPRFFFFNKFKSFYLRILGAKIGKRVVYYPGVWIMPCKNLVLGDDVDLSSGVIITTGGGVQIGKRTWVGYRSQILSVNHSIPPVPKRFSESTDIKKKVVIGDDVWIGANCLILPGVSIGEGAVVAGGSVVTKDVPDFSVVAGVPARILRYREFI
jgi:acetyltransferase-like isoleucine patch superfamily enzyme